VYACLTWFVYFFSTFPVIGIYVAAIKAVVNFTVCNVNASHTDVTAFVPGAAPCCAAHFIGLLFPVLGLNSGTSHMSLALLTMAVARWLETVFCARGVSDVIVQCFSTTDRRVLHGTRLTSLHHNMTLFGLSLFYAHHLAGFRFPNVHIFQYGINVCTETRTTRSDFVGVRAFCISGP
jgi:hypothetical protein